MIKLFTALLSLLERLLKLWEAKRQQRKQQQYQDSIDDIHQNPVDYANGKFGSKRLRQHESNSKPKRVRGSDTGAS